MEIKMLFKTDSMGRGGYQLGSLGPADWGSENLVVKRTQSKEAAKSQVDIF
jgi:hypothetical protein